MNNIIEDYNILLRKYFLEENKFNLYNDFYLLLNRIGKDLNNLKRIKDNCLNFFISKLKKMEIKIKSIINLLDTIAYNKWKEYENKETVVINVKENKLKVYKRFLNFKIESHNDPFTSDEKKYCLYMANSIKNNYNEFNDIPLNIINMIIKGIQKNVT